MNDYNGWKYVEAHSSENYLQLKQIQIFKEDIPNIVVIFLNGIIVNNL